MKSVIVEAEVCDKLWRLPSLSRVALPVTSFVYVDDNRGVAGEVADKSADDDTGCRPDESGSMIAAQTTEMILHV